MFYHELCLYYDHHHETLTQNKGVCMDHQMSGNVGGHKIKVFGCTNFSCAQLGHGISHPHRCIKSNNWNYASSKSHRKM